MSSELAGTILTVIGGVAFVVWLITAVSYARLVGAPSPSTSDELIPHKPSGSVIEGAASDDLLAGELEVDGKPAELAARLVSVLAKSGLAGMPVRVLERDDARVIFEIQPVFVPSRQVGVGSLRTRRGEVVFHPPEEGARGVGYTLESVGRKGLVLTGWVFVLLGLAAVVGLYLLLRNFVVDSPRGNVRGQVFQMFQCIHFLWPPWLFGTIERQSRQFGRQALEVLLSNLSYLD